MFPYYIPPVLLPSVRTSQETNYTFAAKTNWLLLFREINAVYSENYKGKNGKVVPVLN
jgi:hypothetical protein